MGSTDSERIIEVVDDSFGYGACDGCGLGDDDDGVWVVIVQTADGVERSFCLRCLDRLGGLPE